MNEKHPTEMADDILLSLGFVEIDNPYTDGEVWSHKRSAGKIYPHILTPDKVAEALIEIGHCEFRRMAAAVISSIDMDDDCSA